MCSSGEGNRAGQAASRADRRLHESYPETAFWEADMNPDVLSPTGSYRRAVSVENDCAPR